MPKYRVPFNRPYTTGRELEYISQAIANHHLSSSGPFSETCRAFLKKTFDCRQAYVTSSATSALEMAAILAGVGPGDEVILPSFTFVTTATAFVLRGATPVFVDIREDTLNLDEKLIAQAITPRTKAIVPVHYAGVACEMGEIRAIAEENNLVVIEDAAHGIRSRYRGRPVGGLGHMAALSFHETKNVIAGEGGALLVNDATFEQRAPVIAEKGTNRASFLNGETDKYTWLDLGSSYLASDLTAAFLWAQLEKLDELTAARLKIWDGYHERLAGLETRGLVRRPIVPAHCEHNAHLYYLLTPGIGARNTLLEKLRTAGIHATFHYVPLHSSPAGKRFGRVSGDMRVTDRVSQSLLRLPLWIGMEDSLDFCCDALKASFPRARASEGFSDLEAPAL